MPNCKYLIKSNPGEEFISPDKAMVSVKLIACDGREKEFTMPVSTTDGSPLTKAIVEAQIEAEAKKHDQQVVIPMPTLNLTKDILIDVLEE